MGSNYGSGRERERASRPSAGLMLAVIGVLGTVGLPALTPRSTAFASEVQLHEVYSISGQYRVFHAGAGNVTGGAAAFGDFDAPLGGVARAYLYWGGNNLPHDDLSTDDTVTLEVSGPGGNFSFPITATTADTVIFERPWAPGTYFWDANQRAFVADVTDFIKPGLNTYAFSDFSMDSELGAGLQIVYPAAGDSQNTSTAGDVTIYQGHDYAYAGWAAAGELNRTWVLNHTFEPADFDREIIATFFVAGGDDTDRPDALWFETGQHQSEAELPTELVGSALAAMIDSDPLRATDGDAWDTVTATVIIPAGATFASFQFQSGGGSGTNPLNESFSWLSASITMVPEPSALALLGLGALLTTRRRR